MKITSRELVLGWITLVVVVLLLSVFLCRSQVDKWRKRRESQSLVLVQIQKHEQLMQEGPEVEKQLAEMQKQLPQHPVEKDVTADVLIKIGKLAKQYDVSMPRRDAGAEESDGELFFELPINCQWEGTDSAITHFLFDLQAKSAMMDVKQFRIQYKGGSVWKGSLTVSSVYGRVGRGE